MARWYELDRALFCFVTAKGLDKILSVGRVQTPTLYMIYQRDQMIKNFKVSTYYELEAEILADDKKFDAKLMPSQQFKDKSKSNYIQT